MARYGPAMMHLPKTLLRLLLARRMPRVLLPGLLLPGLLSLAACDDAEEAPAPQQVRDMAPPDRGLDDASVMGEIDARAPEMLDQAVMPDQAVEPDQAMDAMPNDAAPADAAPMTDMGAPDQGPDAGSPPAPSPVYDPGPFEVRRDRLAEGMSGAPRAMDVYQPVDAPAAPVILWQHGFLLDVALYSDLLTHVASHGFVVVAPQMYPADNIPIGKPTAAEEAATAATILGWIANGLADVVDAPLDGAAPGIAGHSRGGKVTWLLMIEDAARARAIAGVDPVDGQGGPFGGEPRALDNEIDFGGAPTLVLGTGLGAMPVNAFAPACAPEGDAHVRFYDRTSAPIWHGVATAHGHNDMLNDDGCGLLCTACLEGPDRASMRRYVAGQLVAHFSASLRGDADAAAVLTQPAGAPLPATAENR